MNFLLRQREASLQEYMDDPLCDPVLLENTYRQFGAINRMLAGWGRVYRRFIGPRITPGRTHTLLDLGCGGGDLARYISRLARQSGHNLAVHATDPDERAYRFALAAAAVSDGAADSRITWLNQSLEELAGEGRTYDFIISNHLMHHLQNTELRRIMETATTMCREMAIFNDIRRSAAGYLLFGSFIRPLFRNSFIIPDGLISIRRSYTRSELEAVVPEGWKVRTLTPFRLLAIREKNDRPGTLSRRETGEHPA